MPHPIKPGLACFCWEADGEEHGIYLTPLHADFLSRLHGVAPHSMHDGDFLYRDETGETKKGFFASFDTLAGEHIFIFAGMEGRDYIYPLWKHKHDGEND